MSSKLLERIYHTTAAAAAAALLTLLNWKSPNPVRNNRVLLGSLIVPEFV